MEVNSSIPPEDSEINFSFIHRAVPTKTCDLHNSMNSESISSQSNDETQGDHDDRAGGNRAKSSERAVDHFELPTTSSHDGKLSTRFNSIERCAFQKPKSNGNIKSSNFRNCIEFPCGSHSGNCPPEVNHVKHNLSCPDENSYFNLSKIAYQNFQLHKKLESERASNLRITLEEKTSTIHVSHLLKEYGIPITKKLCRGLCRKVNGQSSFDVWASQILPTEEYLLTIKNVLDWQGALMKHGHGNPYYQAPVLLLQHLADCGEPSSYSVWYVLAGLNQNILEEVSSLIDDFLKHPSVIPDKTATFDTNELPLSLRELPVPSFAPIHSTGKPKLSKHHDAPRRKYKGIVLLTFVDDGVDVAVQLKEKLEQQDSGKAAYMVVTLKDCYKYLLKGHVERKINKFYDKSNFVVPILTDGYLKMVTDVRGNQDADYSRSQNPDTKFASYLNSVYISAYMDAGCVNRKIRCFLATRTKVNLYPPYSFSTTSDINALASILQ